MEDPVLDRTVLTAVKMETQACHPSACQAQISLHCQLPVHGQLTCSLGLFLLGKKKSLNQVIRTLSDRKGDSGFTRESPLVCVTQRFQTGLICPPSPTPGHLETHEEVLTSSGQRLSSIPQRTDSPTAELSGPDGPVPRLRNMG